MIGLQDLIFSINAVAPIFALVLLGVFLRQIKFISAEFLNVGTKFVFNIGLPASLFVNLHTAEFRAFLDMPFIALNVGLTLLSFLGIWVVGSRFIKDKAVLGAFVNGAFRGNMAFLGLPLLTNLAGAAGAERGAVILTFILPVYNISSIIIFSRYAMGSRATLSAVLLSIIKNPLIIGVTIAVGFSLLNISLPEFATQTISHLAATATPIALVCLGGGVIFAMDKKFAIATVGAFIKAGVLPVVFVVVGAAFGFRGVDLMAILVLGGAPSAIGGYAMAVHMGADSQTAAGVIFLSTAFSAFFLTFYIFLLRATGFF